MLAQKGKRLPHAKLSILVREARVVEADDLSCSDVLEFDREKIPHLFWARALAWGGYQQAARHLIPLVRHSPGQLKPAARLIVLAFEIMIEIVECEKMVSLYRDCNGGIARYLIDTDSMNLFTFPVFQCCHYNRAVDAGFRNKFYRKVMKCLPTSFQFFLEADEVAACAEQRGHTYDTQQPYQRY